MPQHKLLRYLIGLVLLAALAFGGVNLLVRPPAVGPLASYGMKGYCGAKQQFTVLISADRRGVHVVDDSARTVASWTSPAALRSVSGSLDCTWYVGITVDPGDLVIFSKAGATLHTLPCNSHFRKPGSSSQAAEVPQIDDVTVLGAGSRVYMQSRSDVACIYDSVTRTSLRVLKDEFPVSTKRLANNSLAVIPYSRDGIFVVTDDGIQQRLWPGHDVVSLCRLGTGRFVFGIPVDNGLLAARVERSTVIEQRVLFPKINISTALCSQAAAVIWAFDVESQIYAAYISGNEMVEVAAGASLSGGNHAPADALGAHVADGEIWVTPGQRSNPRGLAEQLWHGALVKGAVVWHKAPSSLWNSELIKTTFSDLKDPSALIVRTTSGAVFEIRFAKGALSSTKLSNRLLKESLRIDYLSPSLVWIEQDELWTPAARMQHPAVAFIFSYWDRPIPRFTLIFLLLFVLSALILPESRIRQYSPIGIIAAAPLLSSPAVANALPWQTAARPLDLALSLVLIAVTLLCMSFASPALFRLLCNFAPFSWITPLLLSNRFIRRSVFTQLAADHIRRIQVVRSLEFGSQSVGELYFELGVTVDGADRSVDGIVELMSLESGETFTIAAEAGAGKSALVREILLRLLHKFRRDGGRVPIFLERVEGNGDFLHTIRHAMGHCAVPANHLAAMIVRGDILLVLDGVSEGLAPSAELAAYMATNDTQRLHIVAAMRPNSGWDAQMAKIRTKMAIHLQPGTIDRIELLRAYCDRISAGSVDEGTLQFVARAAMGADGLYSPLFAKLALLADIGAGAREQAVHSGAVIGLAADKLFGGAAGSTLRGVARTLAAESYWKFGSRQVRAQVAAAIGRDSAALVELGILRKSAGLHFIFWHDLMQTYLAAEQVADIWATDHAALVRAATDPIFKRHRAMGYTDRSNVIVTEMFQACVWTCRDPRGPAVLMRAMLVDWTTRWPERFSIIDIAQAFDAPAGQWIIQQVRDMQLQAAFQVVADGIGEHDEATLVTLFCSLAQKLPTSQACA